MPKPRVTKTTRVHPHVRARALGYEAATTGAHNPYPRGSYCWTSFEHGKLAALAKTTRQD
jgi:hypothetical protein